MQNLISNAIKFVPAQRRATVSIHAAREGDLLRLTVADNGIGIEAARIDELGTPFRRLHSRRKFEGTGLGLAICKRIAEQHGGRLEIESVHGQGSRFHLLIAQA
jgi:signal transduction histidine kinase